MNEKGIIAWIFLSFALASREKTVSINDILLIADGINHSIPNENEVQMAIKWLLKNDLITKNSKKYGLTVKGKDKFKIASFEEGNLRDILKKIEGLI